MVNINDVFNDLANNCNTTLLEQFLNEGGNPDDIILDVVMMICTNAFIILLEHGANIDNEIIEEAKNNFIFMDEPDILLILIENRFVDIEDLDNRLKNKFMPIYYKYLLKKTYPELVYNLTQDYGDNIPIDVLREIYEYLI